MRKILLIICAMFTVLFSVAQERTVKTNYPKGFKKAEIPAAVRNRTATMQRKSPAMDNGIPLNRLESRRMAAPTTAPRTQTTAILEDAIGFTYYDLQTNGTASNRIVKNPDGTISAVWTFSPNANANFPQRGTGYNYYDGTQWYFTPNGPAGDFPQTKIEPADRTGFTNIAVTSSGAEMVSAHSSTLGHMLLTGRPTTGPPTAWTQYNTALGTGTNNDLWAKSTAVGDTIYIICQGSGTTGTPLYGQDGPLLFWRSTDAGQTWPVYRDTIGLIDSTHYEGLGGDAYSIDARGGVVAIAYGDYGTDIGLLKSYDGGDTWTKTIVQTFPIPFFNFDSMFTYMDSDNVVDTMDSNMGDPHVLIDNNGMCHVFFSTMRWWRDSATVAGSFTYTPYTSDQLFYWNETMPSDGYVTIASAQDYNGNDTLDFASPIDTTCNLCGIYRGGLTQIPSAGIDAAGTIYLAYQSLYEGCDTTDYHQLRKHVYIMTSTDNGANWTYPFDIVPSGAQGGDGEHQEAVFATIARTVDNYAYVVYQRDPAPGHALSTNVCEAAENANASDIIVARIESATVGMNTVHSNDMTVSQNFPNPAHDVTSINISLAKSSDIRLVVTDILGNTIHSENLNNAAAGLHTVELRTANLSSGIYFYNVQANGLNVTRKMIVQ